MEFKWNPSYCVSSRRSTLLYEHRSKIRPSSVLAFPTSHPPRHCRSKVPLVHSIIRLARGDMNDGCLHVVVCCMDRQQDAGWRWKQDLSSCVAYLNAGNFSHEVNRWLRPLFVAILSVLTRRVLSAQSHKHHVKDYNWWGLNVEMSRHVATQWYSASVFPF